MLIPAPGSTSRTCGACRRCAGRQACGGQRRRPVTRAEVVHVDAPAASGRKRDARRKGSSSSGAITFARSGMRRSRRRAGARQHVGPRLVTDHTLTATQGDTCLMHTGERTSWTPAGPGPLACGDQRACFCVSAYLMNCCVQPGKPRERRSAPSWGAMPKTVPVRMPTTEETRPPMMGRAGMLEFRDFSGLRVRW